MNKLIKVFSIVFLTFLPSIVWGGNIGGTGWIFEQDDGDITIILFEKDQTFTSLDVIIESNEDGIVWSGDNDTWKQTGDLVLISFSDGYHLCSLNLTSMKRMSGICVNKMGVKNEIKGRLVE